MIDHFLFKCTHMYIIFNIHVHAKDLQKIKIKIKTKTPRITDEGWNSQKRLSDPVEKKMKEWLPDGEEDEGMEKKEDSRYCIFIQSSYQD